MTVNKDLRFEETARRAVGQHAPTPIEDDRIDAVVAYLAETVGGFAYERVTRSEYFAHVGASVPMTGGRSERREARRTRKARARAIRAELVPELQGVKLMKAGPAWLLWLLDPQIWSFLISWITAILDSEEG